MKQGPWTFLVLLFVVLASGRTVAEEPPLIHECEDRDGNVKYQTDSCDDAGASAIPAPRPARRNPIPDFVPILEEDEPVEEGTGPADPGLGSPEQTWRTFLGAMRNGDRVLALSCLSSSARADSSPSIESLPIEKLREWADALPGIDIRGDAGPFRVAIARHRGPRPKWIFFEKTRRGEWKIAAM